MVYTNDITDPLYGKQMELVMLEYKSNTNFTANQDSCFIQKYKTDADLKLLMTHQMDSGNVILPSVSQGLSVVYLNIFTRSTVGLLDHNRLLIDLQPETDEEVGLTLMRPVLVNVAIIMSISVVFCTVYLICIKC
jgi:hypothetical protein